jgi:Ca2+-binding EF-hand superfamily protein
MATIDRKTIIEEEKKKIFATRRQADIREIVTTARTLGYEKTHEFIYAALVNISDALEGEWIGFEQFLTLLTEAIVHV